MSNRNRNHSSADHCGRKRVVRANDPFGEAQEQIAAIWWSVGGKDTIGADREIISTEYIGAIRNGEPVVLGKFR